MKQVIRINCFETSSSSMHSIIVTKNDTHVTHEELNGNEYCDETVYIDKNGVMKLCDVSNGFGRGPFDILTTFKEKLKYAMCEYLGYLYPDDPRYDEYYSMFKEIVKSVLPEFEEFHTQKRELDIYVDKDGNPIKHKDLHYAGYNKETERSEYYYIDSDGNEQNAILDESNYYEYPLIGIIDHQSSGLLKHFLKNNKISLEEFLTNKKYAIVIDGDEYCNFDRILKSGIIDAKFITETYDIDSLFAK